MRERGFTLLEILVALVVLGFVVAGLSQGLRFGLRATERQERVAAQHGDLDAVDRLLRALIVQIDPGTDREPNPLRGERGGAGFTTDLGAAASALATTRAVMRLEVSGGLLVLQWRPALHVVRLAPPPPPQRAVLLNGLAGIELSYWGPVDGAPPAWHDGWTQSALPGLVRIRLVFPDGSGRRWPDIVAGPARPRPPA